MDMTSIIMRAKGIDGFLTHYENEGKRKLLFKTHEARDEALRTIQLEFVEDGIPELTIDSDGSVGILIVFFP